MMSDKHREKLVNKISRAMITGVIIPEEIKIGGETFKLRLFIHEILMKKTSGTIKEKDSEKIMDALDSINKLFNEEFSRLKNEKLLSEEARTATDFCLGLIKAKKVLEMREKENRIKELKRWLKWVRRIS